MLGLDWWHLYLYIVGLLPMLANVEAHPNQKDHTRRQVAGYYAGQLLVSLLWPLTVPAGFTVQGLSNYRIVHKSVLDKTKPPG